jgi:hypothetical protein
VKKYILAGPLYRLTPQGLTNKYSMKSAGPDANFITASSRLPEKTFISAAENVPQALKSGWVLKALRARVNSCPSRNQSRGIFHQPGISN